MSTKISSRFLKNVYFKDLFLRHILWY